MMDEVRLASSVQIINYIESTDVQPAAHIAHVKKTKRCPEIPVHFSTAGVDVSVVTAIRNIDDMASELLQFKHVTLTSSELKLTALGNLWLCTWSHRPS